MKVYVFDIDLDSGEISNIHRQFKTDGCGFDMSDFHTGMEDLEYDRDVPDNFGRGEE